MKFGRLILRLIVGGYFFGHGTQKLFGWFGGYGPDGTGQFFESIGLRPGKRHALAAGAAEAGGGALLVAGAATPIAASVLTATMLTAINRVHLKNGPWVTDQGYEYNLVLIAVALALAETGPGSPSIDDAIGAKWYGPKWAVRSLRARHHRGGRRAHRRRERPGSRARPAEAEAAAEPQAEAAAPSG